MNFLKARLVEIGVTPAAFARALGLPKARAYEMQKGTRKLQPDEIGPAARVLRWTEAELVARLEGRTVASQSQAAPHANETFGREPLRKGDNVAPPLLLYRAAAAAPGRNGAFMLYADRVGEVERPDFLRFSDKAFATKILGDRNAPAYRTRDIILVDPDSPPVADEDCLFLNGDTVQNGTLAVVGCLISSTANHWKIREYAVRGERELPKADFPHAWPIVGRYNRR